jgi:hypothetical protein
MAVEADWLDAANINQFVLAQTLSTSEAVF